MVTWEPGESNSKMGTKNYLHQVLRTFFNERGCTKFLINRSNKKQFLNGQNWRTIVSLTFLGKISIYFLGSGKILPSKKVIASEVYYVLTIQR